MDIEWVRLGCAFFGGALLTLGGSIVQGVCQNDLAAPSTLGLNALSLLVILLAHFLLLLFPIAWPLEWFSFVMFVTIASFLYWFFGQKSRKRHFYSNLVESKINQLILIGLCFNLFVGALFSLLQFAFMALNVTFPEELWFGNFRYFDTPTFWTIAVAAIALYKIVLALAPSLKAMTFGANWAFGLGIDVASLQVRGLFLALFCVGIVNCFFGVFSFVGLIFPHLLRCFNFIACDFQKELIYGPLIGGCIFAIMDGVCWFFPFYGAEIPVGMVSSILGALLLMIAMIKRRKSAF